MIYLCFFLQLAKKVRKRNRILGHEQTSTNLISLRSSLSYFLDYMGGGARLSQLLVRMLGDHTISSSLVKPPCLPPWTWGWTHAAWWCLRSLFSSNSLPPPPSGGGWSKNLEAQTKKTAIPRRTPVWCSNGLTSGRIRPVNAHHSAFWIGFLPYRITQG